MILHSSRRLASCLATSCQNGKWPFLRFLSLGDAAWIQRGSYHALCKRAELSKKGGIRVLARFIVEQQWHEQLKLKCVMPTPVVSQNRIEKKKVSWMTKTNTPISSLICLQSSPLNPTTLLRVGLEPWSLACEVGAQTRMLNSKHCIL